MSRYGSSAEGKVYVGDLPPDASEKELERAFNYYGHLRNVWVARNPPGFAFLEFEDYRDAEDAVRGLDGTVICGNRVRVELSTGRVRPKGGARGPPRRAFRPEDRCYECGDRGHYAYDCSKARRGGGGGGGGHGGGGGRSSRRSYSRSRSRSRSRGRRYSRSRSPTKSRSRTPAERNERRRSHSRSRSVSRRRDSPEAARHSDD